MENNETVQEAEAKTSYPAFIREHLLRGGKVKHSQWVYTYRPAPDNKPAFAGHLLNAAGDVHCTVTMFGEDSMRVTTWLLNECYSKTVQFAHLDVSL